MRDLDLSYSSCNMQERETCLEFIKKVEQGK